MIETFNSMEVFEFLLCVLIILALLLEAISFWKTNKQSELSFTLINATLY